MWERESAQYNSIEYGELRRHPADPKPKYEHGQKTKSPILKQNTKTDAHILKKRIHKLSGLAIGVVGFDDPAVAELNDPVSISRIFFRVRDLDNRHSFAVEL